MQLDYINTGRSSIVADFYDTLRNNTQVSDEHLCIDVLHLKKTVLPLQIYNAYLGQLFSVQ